MILDSIKYRNNYNAYFPKIVRLLEKASQYNSNNYPEGKLDIDESMFIMFADYETTPIEEAEFEGHRKYIDVMYMVEGEETIYVNNIDRITEFSMEYKEADDAFLAPFNEEATAVNIKAGEFVILFPNDAHAPGCQTAKGSQRVKKIIGKVLVDSL